MPSTDADLTTRERHRRATHQRIFGAALTAIRRDGVARTSMAAVADAAGVSRQTLYQHFPTLDDVVAEAFTEYRARVAARVLGRVDGESELVLVLHEVVDAFFAEMEPAGSRLAAEIGAYLVRGVEVVGWLDEPLFALVRSAVARQRDAGRIPWDLRPADTARLVLTSLGGFLLIDSESPTTRARRAHTTVDLLLRGMAR